MEKLKQLLNDSGIKPTIQRIKILEYLANVDSHPTADRIYSALYKKVPTLSKTTVYNTLDILQKHNLVNVVAITSSELRYEYNHGTHHHFLCRQCGRIFDIHIECPIHRTNELQGHRIEKIEGYINGICKDCLQKEAEQLPQKENSQK